MINVFAEKRNGEEHFDTITIVKGDLTLSLDKKDCVMLLDVLKGKRGIIHCHENEKQYQAEKLIMFSSEKQTILVSYP